MLFHGPHGPEQAQLLWGACVASDLLKKPGKRSSLRQEKRLTHRVHLDKIPNRDHADIGVLRTVCEPMGRPVIPNHPADHGALQSALHGPGASSLRCVASAVAELRWRNKRASLGVQKLGMFRPKW